MPGVVPHTCNPRMHGRPVQEDQELEGLPGLHSKPILGKRNA